jgi:hypothetical protein
MSNSDSSDQGQQQGDGYTPREQGLMYGVLMVGKLVTEDRALPDTVNPLDADSLWQTFGASLPLDEYPYGDLDAEAFKGGVRDGLTYGVVKAQLAVAGVWEGGDTDDVVVEAAVSGFTAGASWAAGELGLPEDELIPFTERARQAWSRLYGDDDDLEGG